MKRYASASQRFVFSRDQGDLPPVLRWLFAAEPSIVCQPATIEEAAAEVKELYARGTPIVARGAGSTAFGQAVPVLGGAVIDLSFLKSVVDFDPQDGTVLVEAGLRWADLDAWLGERGWAVGSYPSSWYSTIGGWVQTGGCGMLTRRFGALRSQVLRLVVCGGDGEIRDLGPDSPDFDAFFETEGQMGLALAVTLKVRRRPRGEYPLLFECPDLASAGRFYSDAAERPDTAHASLYNAARMSRFNREFARRMEAKGSGLASRPLFAGAPAILLYAETEEEWRSLRLWARGESREESADHKAAWLWHERFYPMKGKRPDERWLGNEVVLLDESAGAYAAALERLGRDEGLEFAFEANAGPDGRTIAIATFPVAYPSQGAFLRRLGTVARMDRLAFEAHVARPYHIGVYNARQVGRKFGAERLARLVEAKRRLDPKGLFNPGKFFAMRSRWARWLPAAAQDRLAAKLLAALETPWRARLGAWLASLSPARPDPEPRGDALVVAARECVNCGFCIPVCPAYLATRDERTTARGKLLLGLSVARGRRQDEEDLRLLHSCMHCGACTAVCQNAIDLVPVWRGLEERSAAASGGKPEAAVEAFVREVEASSDYRRLLRRGTIAGQAS